MHAFLIVLIILSLLTVVGTLAFGVVGMFRGAPPRRSNRLMQLRVLFQFVAIVLFMIFIWLYRST
jgi:uncharacterized BrkB/YihY/UPF0761 family membrane protein